MEETKFETKLRKEIEQLVNNLFWNTDVKTKQRMIYDFVKRKIAENRIKVDLRSVKND